jgi:hypothetical protein
MGGDGFTNVRLNNSQHRFAVGLALDGAARQLDDPECLALLDEFEDAEGRPLRASLEASGLGASAYLGRLLFYDAPPPACGTANLAITTPRSRVIFICGSRVVREMKSRSRHVEAILIHEMLHSLGLGENPPSSDHITSRVRVRCGLPGKASAPKRPEASAGRP